MDKKTRYITDFLFSTPSIISGAGTVINLSGNYFDYNVCDTEIEADAKAIRSDFGVIGQDIEESFQKAYLVAEKK